MINTLNCLNNDEIDEFVLNVKLELQNKVLLFEQWKSCYRVYYLLRNNGVFSRDLGKALISKNFSCDGFNENKMISFYKEDLRVDLSSHVKRLR